MPACCLRGCPGGGGGEDEDGEPKALELELLEAKEHSIQFSVRVPKAARSSSAASYAAPSSSWRRRAAEENAEATVLVSVLGGPYSDIRGAQEETLTARHGAQLTHEISGLQPETEYTIRVSCTSTVAPLNGLSSSIDVRTDKARTALFADEDWGRMRGDSPTKGSFQKGDYNIGKANDPSADKKPAPGGGPSAFARSALESSRPQPSGGSAAAAAAADDTSTICPSESPQWPGASLGEDGDGETSAAVRQASFDDAASDWASERGGGELTLAPDATPAPPTASMPSPVSADVEEAVAESSCSAQPGPPLSEAPECDEEPPREPEVRETTSPARTPKCNLCSMLDCLKQGRSDAELSEAAEITIDQNGRGARGGGMPAPAPKRSFRPYRHPFPGRAVDPAAVGLEHLEVQNLAAATSVGAAGNFRRGG